MGYTLLDDSGQPVKGTYTLLPDNAPAPQPKPFGQQLNDAIADVPRQLGLTARYGLEGVGGALDFLASPIRAGLNAVGVNSKPGSGTLLADQLGLPQPRTAQERVVGDVARTMAGTVVPVGAGAALAKNATGTAQAVGRVMAANPGQQLVSAAGAGGAGGYTRETGGNDLAQMLASVAGGLAAPAAMGVAQRGASAAARVVAPKTSVPQQVEVTINSALQPSGLTLGDLPTNVASGIRNDVAAAYKTSGVLDPEAIRRLADYRLTGATPTAAGLTLDPAIVSQQKNLAKLGINSKDPAAQQLGQTQNANNRALINGLNDLGAGLGGDQIGGAQTIMGALAGRDAQEQSIINALYGQARDSAGRAAPLDPYAFTQRAGDLLNDANVESFLTPDIRNKLNGFASGQIPLNVDIAEQFKTGIGKLQRNSSDGNVRTALGLVRQALDETPLLGQGGPTPTFGGNQMAAPGGLAGAAPVASLGQDAIDAFTRARAANRNWMQTVESTPALAAVRDGVEPDKFVQQFIVGSGNGASVMSVAQLKNQIGGSQDAMNAVRQQIAGYLKQKALGGAADEVGNFSQSNYNAALKAIGDRKLNLFFKPEEVAQMKAIGRVASYEQFQPSGSAVNNSNTAGTAGAMLLDRIANSALLSKIPMLGSAVQPAAQNIVIGMKAGQALNVPSNLAVPQPRVPVLAPGMALSPAAFLLQQDDRNR
ncbi:hypothetical protein AB595_04685 [Massilia sp. WF1]|uniref:hypothetical protein n=1 Tax=unclassified Massilia TaxID=2609279 RepID=UPI0006495603|nr:MULTISPECIES: hypothetical protein [unclassified Massilia]ALK96972.1 hypothetical protein AM586_12590 [Massilia sp. WG5]KLU37924.1 hypothetical protein AB595_04685 [Massilia sp. WF1]